MMATGQPLQVHEKTITSSESPSGIWINVQNSDMQTTGHALNLRKLRSTMDGRGAVIAEIIAGVTRGARQFEELSTGPKVYWLTISCRAETGGERSPKRDPEFDPFLATGAKDRISH
jgi:hypothetical protein